jgi:hypothetical protein
MLQLFGRCTFLHRVTLPTILALFVFLLVAPAHAVGTADLPMIRLPAMIRLPGHVLPVLAKATLLQTKPDADNQALTLTIVLRRDDQKGFERYLYDLYDPHSPTYRHFLTQRQIADRFGPSRGDYDSLLGYFRSHQFKLLWGSKNRLTITLLGKRSQVANVLHLHVADYRIGNRRFYANDRDPALPGSLAPRVATITGLSNLARPKNTRQFLISALCGISSVWLSIASRNLQNPGLGYGALWSGAFCLVEVFFAALFPDPTEATDPPSGLLGITGAGQTIGLLEFDTFQRSDVVDYLRMLTTVGIPAGAISHLTQVNVNGGASPGSDAGEVLLDIDTALTVAPGAKVAVYDAPFTGPGASFQELFNAMIDDGVNVISNSWAYCEDQTTQADVSSIDAILATAAASGISVFNGSGDSGSTCLDGSPNTVAVPADSPHATAVGGTSLKVGPGYTYQTETWWNGTSHTPPTGEGGFGFSKFFPAPSYQKGLTASGMRSVPDVVVNADPASGIVICQASAGGCPTGELNGGTSLAAPTWAAFTALLNQAQGSKLGELNLRLYPLAGTSAFHSAASMGSDFSHVGLGSPNVNQLHLRLSGMSVGSPSATNSTLNGFFPRASFSSVPLNVPADGTSAATVAATLIDSNGNPVSGKTVMLSANSASTATIRPTSSVSSVNNGTASFNITDLNAETATFTAEDVTDGIALTQTYQIRFGTPPAAAASFFAGPSQVTANGIAPADITVTLEDALGRPTPGKLIQINQTGGNSVISGPDPPVTNSSGQIDFTAVDSNNETITYSAADVTDGNVPFPQTGTVTFSNAPEPSCSNSFVAAPGFVAQPYATGFLAQNVCFGGLCSSPCPGAFGIAFDKSGNLYSVDQATGDIYKIPPGGGVADLSTLLTRTALPTLDTLVTDSSGNLYGGMNASFSGGSFDFSNGQIVQIDTSTGEVSRTVASGLTCPGLIGIDPLSGDLFADDNCSGGLSNNWLWRISNPTGTPSTSVYTTLPGSPNGTIAFAPNGTIYIPTTVGGTGELVQVSGTNAGSPTVSTLTTTPNLFGLGLIAQGPANAPPKLLISSFEQTGNVPGGIGTFDLTGAPVTQSNTLVTDNGQAVDMKIGPDGCVYAARGVAVWRITDTKGACTYAAAKPAPALYLTPIGVSPNPAQGSSLAFTASVQYASVPDGTPVLLDVNGANPQIVQASTTGGVASFSYTGAHQGVDTLTATATVNGTVATSNDAVITWAPGTDVTFLTLNLSPRSATPGEPVTLTASLSDISKSPVVPIVGVPITIGLGNDTCSASTDANGNASCQVNPEIIPGNPLRSLTATFAGTADLTAAEASDGFMFTAPPEEHRLRVRPRVLHFGGHDLGTTSEPKVVRVFNPTRKKKKITLTFLGAENTGDFTIISGPPTTCDDNLAPKQRCDIALTFSPTAGGRRKGTLVVYDNAERNEPQKVKLRGVGEAAGEAGLSPDDSESAPDDPDDDPVSEP